ncbi:replication-relaxation family protein [Rubrobacter tropicus]|uniref:replication-relaxation family protein n=1 Tax=Rubrobacter tropicus TaxID=2653851 RepID=UPI00140A9BC4|nr:replication-relaxation family protein [Rubrobacter tropicus]
MAKKSSGRGQITPRDERIFRDLYHTRILTTRQIAAMHFPSYETGRRRLYDLKWSGKIENHVFRASTEDSLDEDVNVWMLTSKGFRYVLEDLEKEKPERYPDWPSRRNVRHYLDANEVYVMASGALDAVLGSYPAWEWRDERGASRRWNMGGRERTHRPDAEVRFGDTVYFIERETARSRKSPNHFVNRMEDYAGYIRYARANGAAESFKVMWACDTERDENHAADAGERFAVPTYAGTPREVSQRLKQHAQESVQLAVASGARG